MKTIQVNASKPYRVIIGDDLLSSLPDYLPIGQKVAIVSDSNVWPLYGNTVTNLLENAGHEVFSYVFPAGEKSKSINAYSEICNFLASCQITRSSYLIALGGGVVGDMTGFVAATYLRGISYIQIPTTVLAMVDSSVGGKTAVDIPAGKNLIGAFYHPDLVICDLKLLKTLPHDVFVNGCAEIIKYAILYDSELFAHLAETGVSFNSEYVICRCINLKRMVVEKDEFDHGDRQMLNLGHTIGHSIESISKYEISHGEAVAVGICIISAVSCSLGYCSQEFVSKIKNIFSKFGFVFQIPYCAEDLVRQILTDKKRAGNDINLIMPIEIGNCQIKNTPISQLQSILEAGLTLWTLS